jgi:hypothetical protein
LVVVKKPDLSERHERVKDLFFAACELPPEERRRFLDERCDDEAVRQEIESLLRYHDAIRAGSQTKRD